METASHSTKNITSVVTQRKSSSHKGRRVDINALNQSSNGITTSHSNANHPRGDSNTNAQTNTSSIVTSGSHGSASEMQSASAKGRTLLKN